MSSLRAFRAADRSGAGFVSAGGFTLPELLIVIALGVVISALTLPAALRFYRAELVDDSTLNVKEALRRARSFAVSGKGGSPHGVKLLQGEIVLFRGASYAARQADFDERSELPSAVSVSATLYEYVFSSLYGTSTAGEINFSLEASSSTITVNGQGTVQWR